MPVKVYIHGTLRWTFASWSEALQEERIVRALICVAPDIRIRGYVGAVRLYLS